MKKFFLTAAVALMSGLMMTPQVEAQTRRGAGRTTTTQRASSNSGSGNTRGGNSSTSTSRPGSSSNTSTTRPGSSSNTSTRPGSSSTTRPGASTNTRPGNSLQPDKPQQSGRPGAATPPATQPGVGTPPTSNRPGAAAPPSTRPGAGTRPGALAPTPSVRPGAGLRPGAATPRPTPTRPGAAVAHPNPAVRPGAVNRPPVLAPPTRPGRPIYSSPWTRPVPPPNWTPTYKRPLLANVLGLTFGIAISSAIDNLYSSGYGVDGYDNQEVYLRGVTERGYYWDDATLFFSPSGELVRSQFYDASTIYSPARYYNLFNSFVTDYGMPVNTTTRSAGGNLSATWFGGGQYINLELTLMPTASGNRYCTILTYGN